MRLKAPYDLRSPTVSYEPQPSSGTIRDSHPEAGIEHLVIEHLADYAPTPPRGTDVRRIEIVADNLIQFSGDSLVSVLQPTTGIFVLNSLRNFCRRHTATQHNIGTENQAPSEDGWETAATLKSYKSTFYVGTNNQACNPSTFLRCIEALDRWSLGKTGRPLVERSKRGSGGITKYRLESDIGWRDLRTHRSPLNNPR